MKSTDQKKNVLDFSRSVKRNILDMSLEAGASSAHIGGALSIVEIISFLFNYQMKLNVGNKKKSTASDKFILSKGHACLAYYSALYSSGLISKEEIKSFEKDDSFLAGHPVKNLDLGIDFSTGSLGMGLSIGVGLSIASKKKSSGNQIYVIIGDGECNEGSIWESALCASKYNLDNLNVIIDRNNFQQTGSNDEIMNLGELNSKWRSFGWDTFEIDGHSIDEIFDVFSKITDEKKPKVIIANTIKGKGFSFSENNNDWHHSIMTKKIYDEAIKELENGN